eukprot:tig00021013_g17070.t1
MLEGGQPVDSTNKEGLTALYIACENGHEAAARLLLERGADSMLPCGDRGRLPIHAGAAGEHEPIVRLLLGRGMPVDAKTKRGATVLYIACQEGREAVARLLLERGADPALCDERGWHPLHAAADSGRTAIVKLLLERGAPVDAKNNYAVTALYLAAQNSDVDVTRLLLEHGADPALCDERGWHPLHAAAGNGHGAIVKLLLERGAPVDAKTNSGRTALHMACTLGHVDVARLLLEHGADPSLPDEDGQHPLHAAAGNGHGAIVKILLERGAPVDSKDKEGGTALFMASVMGDEDIARILLEHGADTMLSCDAESDPENCDLLPIHAASLATKNISLVKLLLERGNPAAVTAACTLNSRKGTTLLHIAACQGYVDIIRLCLEHGAVLEAENDRGWTPLMDAIWAGEAPVARSLLEAGAAWDTEDKEGVTALELALRWRQGAFLNPFLDCPRVLFTAAKLASICEQIIAAVGAECNPAAVVAKFPSHKLHCALHLARLLERAAKANPDQASVILEHRDEAINVAYQLLDAMGRKFGERLQRRARNDSAQVTWMGLMRSLAEETEDKKLEERLRDCVELTADDPLDTWHANQLKNANWRSIFSSTFEWATDQWGPIADSVEALEKSLPGVGSPLDIAIELDLYPFFGHPFVHRYIQRISESASDMQAVSLLPSALVSLAKKLPSWLRDAGKQGKSEEKDGESEESAGEDKQPNEGELWWETPGHPLNSWKGKFAADLTTYLIFLVLIALAVWSGRVFGEHGHGRPSVLGLLALQSLCMLLREYYQAREEGIRDYFGDVFNLFDLALFIATPLFAILGIITEAVPAFAYLGDNMIPALALIFIPASLRLLEFGYISPMLGPMLVVFGRMAQNVLSVLIVFLLVFASFLFALWGWSASILGRASDGEPPITFLETAGSLYFGFLGESDYDLMRSRIPLVGSAFFSIYQIITVILLLNVLTGLFSFSFTDVFENAQHVYAFGRAKIILRYHRMGRRLVAPLNVVWLLLSPAPRLAAAVINVISAVFFLPFLAVALGLSHLSRLVENLFGTPAEKKKQQEAASAQSGALEAWLKAIETHRKARLADAAKEQPDAPLELKLKFPLAYDEANEKPDPVPPGPLKVAHTAENVPRNLETIHERTEKLEAGQAKLEEKIDAGQAKLEEKFEASLAEVKAVLAELKAAITAPAARRSLFEF